ncbi:MAG: hypothetical protein ACRDJ1_01815 [Actinomycetota bacterium]
MVPIFMMMGFGMASTMAPMTAAVMNAVGPERAGLGSATTNTTREVGGTFGIALLGTLLTTKLKGSLGTALAGIGLSGAQQSAIVENAGHLHLSGEALAGLTPAQQGAVAQAFAGSFIDGYQLALMTGGLVVLAAAVIAWRFIPGVPAGHVPAKVEAEVAATV